MKKGEREGRGITLTLLLLMRHLIVNGKSLNLFLSTEEVMAFLQLPSGVLQEVKEGDTPQQFI